MELQKAGYQKQSRNFKNVGVLLYIDKQEQLNELDKIVHHSFFNDRQVKFLTWFKPTKKTTYPELNNVVFVDNSDFEKGLPQSSTVRQFCEEQFDLLMDLCLRPWTPFHNLAIRSNAILKTGMSDKPSEGYHFCIKPVRKTPNSPRALLENMQVYLERIF